MKFLAKFILYTFIITLLSNQLGIVFAILILITWTYLRIIWMPIPVIIAAYIWYHLEPLYWYLRLILLSRCNYFLKCINTRSQITLR